MNNNCNSNVMNTKQDDGTLKCLGLKKRPKKGWFNCKKVEQEQLKDKTFYVLDFQHVKKTSYGYNRVVVKIGRTPNDPEEVCGKFFSGSGDVKDILEQLRELDAFPRKVTLRKHKETKSGYYLE